jgi:hypothetical protein
MALAFAALAVAAAALGLGAPGAERAAAAGAAAEGDANPAWGPGWVVWESNRGGSFRIWRRALEGGRALRVTPDEPGRDHCCAQISPDGRRLVYLSLPGGARSYLPPTAEGELHVALADGTLDRVVAPRARHYGEHRAAIWWAPDELVYLQPDGATVALDLSTGSRRIVARAAADGEGWLVEPTGRWATGGTPTFSARDPATGEVRRATPLGGCQPEFDRRGRFGIWSAGAGGPIDAIELETRRTFTLLAKSDPRLPAGRGYVYFPKLSADGSLLALAGSDGAHDHFRADYDVLVIEVDPQTLEPLGRAVRITAHPAVDRFPDVHRAEPPAVAPAPAARAAARPAPPVRTATGWPPSRERLAFAWEGAERANRISPDAESDVLEPRGRAGFDRRGRMWLDGGLFAAPAATSARVLETLRGTNTMTFEAVVQAARHEAAGAAPIAALTVRPGRRSFLVRQANDRFELVLRSSESAPAGGAPVPLARVPDSRPHHLAFAFSPGRLAAYLDGAPAGAAVVPGDFFHWRDGALVFGGEPGGDGRFRGALSHVAIHARELGAEEIGVAARAALAALEAGPEVPFLEVDAKLLARSRIPTLEEISPYRQALAVEEWEIRKRRAGADVEGRIRVARWMLFDGRPTPESAVPIGELARLRVEPHAAQPQLESVVLSDTLPPPPPGAPPLGFDVGWGD